jgi:hypothetical protein
MPQDKSDRSAFGGRQPASGDQETQRDNQQIADDNQQSGTVGQEDAGGISNRPLEEEEENQERVPPRGDRKEGSHA